MSSSIYQVFVSSTYLDLVEERRVVLEILPQMGCLPLLLPSQGPQAWPGVRRRIEASDYYLLLVGSRYGSLTPSGVSHTHQEYVYARHKKKPMLIFMHAAPEQRPDSVQETTQAGRGRFLDFRQMVSGDISFWQTAADLSRILRSKIPAFIEQNPCEGWVKTGESVKLSLGASALGASALGASALGALEREAGRAKLVPPAAPVRSKPVADVDLEEARARIAELEAEREQWLLGQVKAADLAQGNEPVELNYQANVYFGGHCELLLLQTNVSWHEVFLALAIHLKQPQSEKFMQERLAEFLRQRGLEDAQQLRPKAHALTDIRIHELTFASVRVQLRTLGWIIRSRLVQRLPHGDVLWQLSTQGELLMNRLLLRYKVQS